ncbi:ig-like domain-containing protein [Trichonephila inaurata madagascariensis]|uniref:Ig-like domain-containing protein n=1 Tax=Trichonephila inaurata madagascariensis TaxID=2747483 RepID=A0A8X6X4G5_9ARAC|nr:ig-like domain-containing protein [Trichonephila inaurata madagascariensis]
MCIFFISVCFGVEIRRLSVPRWVENGTEKSVTLDCDYIYNENDIRLVVKWFFEENLEPVYQWIPELGTRHTSGILRDRLDLNYTVNTVDAYSRYRALKISQPSTELSGKYTCLVTSLAGQDSKAQLMTVFVPAQTMDVKYHTTSTNLNVSCEATGLFPRPKLKLYRILPKEKTPAIVKDVSTSIWNSRDTYNTSLYRSFEYDELSLPGTSGFECVVEIPGTNYQRKKRVAYFAGTSQVSIYLYLDG